MGETKNFTVEEVFPKLEVHRYGEVTALYVNGKLDRTSEEYIIVERVFELLGVRLVTDGAFIRGDADTFAATLDDVEAYRRQREADRGEAQRLRAQARDCVAQAEALERKHGRAS